MSLEWKEAKAKSDSFLSKSCGRTLDYPWYVPNKTTTFLTSPLSKSSKRANYLSIPHSFVDFVREKEGSLAIYLPDIIGLSEKTRTRIEFASFLISNSGSKLGSRNSEF